MNKKTILIALVVALLVGGAGGGGWWYYQQREDAAPPQPEAVEYRFVSLDKTIVMLRSEAGGEPSYMAVDLVFRSTLEDERKVKDQLPMLKSVAVRVLSQLSRERAGKLGIEAYQQLLSQAYAAAYRREGQPSPFREVMISKLIIE
ncbi:flagellar basal body-associated protein FliL [Xenophilus sp. AP218F]|nr:flagellar basal body-associated protein FliL [Xenophilus sp. AP218F]